MSETPMRPTSIPATANCPFEPCKAIVDLLHGPRAPGPIAGPQVTRVKPHTIVGPFEWWGNCPGSHVTLPINDATHAALSDYAATVRRAAARRDAIPPLPPGNRRANEHSLTPHPDPNHEFMRLGRHKGDNPRGEAAPPPPTPMRPVMIPRVGQLPARVDYPKGDAVASVAEVRAAIDQANALIAEAQFMNNTVVGAKLSEAKVLLDWIRQTSVDPLGAPQVAAAIEATETVTGLCHLAIEAATTYGATL